MRARVEVEVDVEFDIRNREPIERVTGPGGDEWRASAYPLRTEADVLEHWAYNALANGVGDISALDGWADVPKGVVTMRAVVQRTHVAEAVTR